VAKIDDLVEQVKDQGHQSKLRAAVAELKARTRFGLVFEEHIPETAALFGLPISPGATVQLRTENRRLYRVLSVRNGVATLDPIDDGKPRDEATGDLLVVKRFGEPIYPTLTPLGAVRRADPSRPAHAVINGENYHALQLLAYLCGGQVDCIYIDPPYNSGARDWRYNNRFVDNIDTWHHSKWLSFMDKRLKLAKQLLKPESGVLIVTVDENEVHHLALLLERLFPDPDYLRYTITIVYNPKGTAKPNFGRVDEQALFVTPNVGHDLINPRPASTVDHDPPEITELEELVRNLIDAGHLDTTTLLADDSPLEPSLRGALEQVLETDPHPTRQLELSDLGKAREDDATVQDDDDEDEQGDEDVDGPAVSLGGKRPDGYEDLFLRRRGQESSHRANRPNQFYAILVDEEKREVVGIGPPLGRDDRYEVTKQATC
jgi:DNA methylase